MCVVSRLREMIGDMYAVYVLDLGVHLGLFDELAEVAVPVSFDDIASKIKLKGNKELFFSFIRAVCAAGFVEIDDKNYVSIKEEWKDALTNTKSIDYIATLPRCYIASLEDFSKFKNVIKNGGLISWQSLNIAAIDAISADAVRSANYFIEVVAKKINGLKDKLETGAVVYDLGCAAGHSTMRLAEEFSSSKFIGIDVLPAAINLAKRYAKKSKLSNVSFLNICATRLPKGTADLIILNDVFHEMDVNLRGCALKAIRRSIKSGGGMFFSDPLAPANYKDLSSDIFRASTITSFFEAPYGAKVCTRSEIIGFFKDAGFNSIFDMEVSENEICAYLSIS